MACFTELFCPADRTPPSSALRLVLALMLAVTSLSALDAPPSIATAAAATPALVTAKTTRLTVVGADDGGATALVYTWSTSGPAAVTFSATGTNAAKTVTATFTAPGDYICTATVRDAGGQTATSSVTVSVASTLTTLALNATSAVVNPGVTKQFTATAKNQFGTVLVGEPLVWSATGAGSVDANGLFTAGATPGAAKVTVVDGAKTASATIRVNAAPSVTLAPIAPVAGTKVAVAATGADADDALTTLKYTWSATGPKTVGFSPNGTAAAAASTASFTAIGTYVLTVTVKDPAGLTAKTSQTVVVQPVPTSATLTPTALVMLSKATKKITAQLRDQFGAALAGTITSASATGATVTFSGNTATVVAGTSAEPGGVSVTFGADPGVTATAAIRFLACEGNGTGLAGTYFDNEDFTGVSVKRIDPQLAYSLNEWPDGKAIDGIGAEWWSAIWVGSIEIPVTGTYTIKTRSNNGVRLQIDGRMVIENWAAHGAETDVATVELTAGKHPIQVRYYNTHGSACMQLWWSSADIPEEYVPQCALYPETLIPVIGTGTGLSATYFDEDNFAGFSTQQVDAQLDFTWTAQTAPAVGIAADVWSGKWVGQIEPEFTDTYTVSIVTNHPVTLAVNGQVIIDDQTDGTEHTVTGTLAMTAGRRYDLLATYRATSSPSRLAMSWSCALAGEMEVVPTLQFYPVNPEAATAIQVLSPLSVYASPAWIEGAVGHWTTGLTASVNGAPVTVARAGAAPWYLTATAAGQPLGVPLSGPTNTLVLDSANGDATQRSERAITWTTIDLANRPYGLDSIDIRPGDSLRLTATGTGTAVELALNQLDGQAFVADLTGSPGEVFVVPFAQPGVHTVVARIDGIEVGRLSVRIPSVNLQGPIACHVDYKRIKDVDLTSNGATVVFTANDASFMEVADQSATATGRRLTMRPVQKTDVVLQARLGGNGPVIVQCPVDVFTLRTTAERGISLVEILPNGNLVLEAQLEMSPLTAGLAVRLSVYTGGLTFADSSLEMIIETEEFLPQANAGIYVYRIIATPEAYACHSTDVFQSGVQVSGQ